MLDWLYEIALSMRGASLEEMQRLQMVSSIPARTDAIAVQQAKLHLPYLR